MHIAYLTNEYPPLSSGGIGISIQNLARELIQQGHKITVLGTGNGQEWADEGVQIRFLKQTRIPKLGWLLNRRLIAREINRMVADEKLDIVEAPDWTGLSAGMKLNCPVIIRCHGSDTYFGSLLGYHPRWSTYLAEVLALSQADCVVAVSRFTAEKSSALFQLAKPIDVIPNGINLERFHPSTYAREDSSLLLYFGTLARKKGVLDLAEIFSQVAARDSSARLMLIGRDSADRETGNPSTWELFRQISSPNALQRVEYLGSKPSNEIISFIHQASICIFPSHAEALPMAWMEAMACGKTVLASDIGWAGEIIENGVSGILANPSDHSKYVEIIIHLLKESKERNILGMAARARIEEKFNIRAIAENNLDFYNRILIQYRSRTLPLNGSEKYDK